MLGQLEEGESGLHVPMHTRRQRKMWLVPPLSHPLSFSLSLSSGCVTVDKASLSHTLKLCLFEQ